VLLKSPPRRAFCAVLFASWSLLNLAAHGEERATRSAAELMDVVMWNREPIGGPFRLIDHQGRERTERDFRGRLMLVYFGFTSCPDICPTDLQQMSFALERLGSDARTVVPIFITLDPQRDTRALLSRYVPSFHPQMVGLTGSEAAIRKAADAYKVYYAKVAVKGAARYTIDHSSFIYLMSPEGKYLGFFPPSTPADRIAQVIRTHL
jgi:cytochrome oxidase Cu insertion factor (SCO1/SenC/PrrC family)